MLGISPETARLADDRALLFQGLDAHGRTAVLALMDADSLNTQPRARRGPAPSHPGSQLSSGYAIEWRTLAKAFAELLVAAHDILAHPLARTAPFEHDARHAKQLEELASSIRRDLELGRAVAARALALGDLAHVFETARDEWPKPRDRTAPRKPAAPRVPTRPSQDEAAALDRQTQALRAWAGRALASGVTFHGDVARGLRLLRASGPFIRSYGGPVKVAADAMTALVSASARTLQGERRLPVVQAHRLTTRPMRRGDPDAADSLAEFTRDIMMNRDPLVSRIARTDPSTHQSQGASLGAVPLAEDPRRPRAYEALPEWNPWNERFDAAIRDLVDGDRLGAMTELEPGPHAFGVERQAPPGACLEVFAVSVRGTRSVVAHVDEFGCIWKPRDDRSRPTRLGSIFDETHV